MNSEIFYEDENKSYDFETPYSSETEIHMTSVVTKETKRSNAELTTASAALITQGTKYAKDDDTSLENSCAFNDYEIVNNEECDQDQQLPEHEHSLQLSTRTFFHEQRKNGQLVCGGGELDENHGMSKLHLSLSAEKISLKSQKAKKKINKSIEKSKVKRKRETQQQNATKTEALTIAAITQQQQQHYQQLTEREREHEQQTQAQQLRHAPVINFTIAPIGCVRHNSGGGNGKCHQNNDTRTVGVADAIDNKRLPEIILPPACSNLATAAARQKQCAHSTARAATVTFRAVATSSSSSSGNYNNNNNMTTTTTAMTKTMLTSSRITPPPVERSTADMTPSRHTTVAEVYDMQEHVCVNDAGGCGGGAGGGSGGGVGVGGCGVVGDDSGGLTLLTFRHIRDIVGDVDGCGGSSTSPESLMDNILSAASSVSVRSSSSQQSCAAGITIGDTALLDIMKIPPPPLPPPLPPPPPALSANTIAKSQARSRAYCDYAMPRPMHAMNPTRIPTIAFTSPATTDHHTQCEGGICGAYSNYNNNNNNNNSSSNTTTSNCNTATITTAWVHQQPMPSVSVAADTSVIDAMPTIIVHKRDDFNVLMPYAAMYDAGRVSPMLYPHELSDGEASRIRSSNSRSTSPLLAAHSMGAIKSQSDTSAKSLKSLSLSLPQPSSQSQSPKPTQIPPSALKCVMCGELMRDPRTLNCLHTFCLQCLVEENVKADVTSIAFWSLPSNGERRLPTSASAVTAVVEQENEMKSKTTGGIGASANAYSKCNGESVHSQSPETSSASCSPSRRTSFNFIRKKSLEKILLKLKPDNNKSDGTKLTLVASTSAASDCGQTTTTAARTSAINASRLIRCQVCNYGTEIPVGGLRQLPQNLLLARRIDAFKRQQMQNITGGSSPKPPMFVSTTLQWCSLCVIETEAVFQCFDCALYLCTLCKESHERQRTTSSHKLQLLPFEARRKLPTETLDTANKTETKLKCSMHGGYEIKAFCSTCLQVACADCLVLLHRGHKHESIAKAVANYSHTLSESAEQTRPLCNYAERTIAQLNEIAEHVNFKCDHVQAQLEAFIEEYMDALEVHHKTLRQQLQRARETKLHMLLEQQVELAKRTKEASEAVRFAQELAIHGSDEELLSFVGVLLKRFEHCQQFEAPDEMKICDTLQLLRQVRAPESKRCHGIPLYGIITTQAVAPSLCTLDWAGCGKLRLSCKIELKLLTRDAHDLQLSHGGLAVQARLRYKIIDKECKDVPPAPRVLITDNNDGTYTLTFTPNATGQMLLYVSIAEKPIKGSPFGFTVSCTRPHTGVYHCCSHCSLSKGSRQRMRRCACTPNSNGCAHGQPSHPGARHWSCCGNLKKYSDCSVESTALLPPPLPPPPPPPPAVIQQTLKSAKSTPIVL